VFPQIDRCPITVLARTLKKIGIKREFRQIRTPHNADKHDEAGRATPREPAIGLRTR
jgi:hypothetical protein